MIRTTVTLDRLGMGVSCTDLCTIEIANDGKGTPTRGNYVVRVLGKDGRLMRSGTVKNWPRQSKHVVDLLAAALQACN